MSDSNYTSVTRYRKPLSTAGRPSQLNVVDDAWAADKLSDDEIDIERHEAAIAPLLEEEGEELDVDVVVVPVNSSSGGGAVANGGVLERRRREDGRWSDLALDYFDTHTNNSANYFSNLRNTGVAGYASRYHSSGDNNPASPNTTRQR